jgi:diacylglycerol kinase family enzyme
LAGNDPENSLKLAKNLERRLKRAKCDCIVHAASSWDEFVKGVITALRVRPYALIVFGGDGSVRMAASRVARVKGLLGIIPCGRYNNIFHSLYGHTNAEEALGIVRSEYQMRIDAGLANGNFFLGSLITGLLPVMINLLGLKNLPRLAMTWSKLAAHAADDTMPRSTAMKVDAYSFKAQPLVLNIHLLSHLMSLRFAPVAVPDDGRITLIYDRDGTRDSVVHYIRDLKKDRYQYNDGIQILRGEKASIAPAEGRIWLLDGDEVEFTGVDIGIEVLHRVLRIFSIAPDKE